MKILSLSDKIILFPLWLLTLLPLPVLYLLSDVISVVLCFIIRYRRQVVLQNLKNSFPEMEPEDIKGIMWRFYRHLSDYFVESIYMLNMSAEECNRRFIYKNPQLVNELFRRGRSMVLAMSHYGCWEWTFNFEACFSHPYYAIYKPLSNKLFDRLFLYMRSRYRTRPIPMKQTPRTIAEGLKKKEIFAICFIADQRPSVHDLHYWTSFLNQETPVITGMDRLARKYNLAVVFMNVARIRRGYYEVTFEMMESEPAGTQPDELTEKYIRSVERQIRNQPEYYLWSHKRWKYKAEQYKPPVHKDV